MTRTDREPTTPQSGSIMEKHEQHHDVAHLERTHSVPEHGMVPRDLVAGEFHFDPVAEKKLLRKIDLMVVPTVMMLYLFCFIDRANIGNARLAGLEKDLKLKGYQYNMLLTSFYIAYIVFEIPANMCCKYFGPAKWIPFISVGFGLMSLCTAFVTNFSNAMAVRFLLGMFEAGVLPGIAFYLARWYRKAELVFRLALYFSTAPLAGAFGGLLASGILKLPGIGSIHTWQQLFFVEGIITIGLALIAFFTMSDSPAHARWLSAEEKKLALARVASEHVSGGKNVVDKFSKARLRRGISNPNTQIVAFIFFWVNVTVQGVAFFTPTIVATIYPKASVIKKQLHTVPPYVVGFCINLILPFLSWKIDRRLVFFIGCAILPIVGYSIFLGTTKAMARYGAVFLVVTGAFPFGCLCNAQVAINAVSDSGRSTGIGWNVMIGNLGGLLSTWCFLPTDAPNYPIGNGINLAGNVLIFLTSIFLYWFLARDNKRRDRVDSTAKLDGLTPEEVDELDWKHPDFRWYL